MQFKRFAFLLVTVMVLPIVLVACGGGLAGDTEDAYKELIEDGNPDKWNEIVCDEAKIDDEVASLMKEDDVEDLEISCEEDGDEIKCEISGKTNGQDQKETVTFTVEDDKICPKS
jgi:hypothetical protein